MEIGWLDSHCHLLDESYLSEIEEVLSRAKENDVFYFLCVATNYKEALKAIELKDKYNIDIAFGYHPEDANSITDEDLDKLDNLLSTGKFIAVGEIGLDYHWVNDNKDKQKDLFIKQIDLANKYNLPILIHSRDAHQDTFDICKNHKVKRNGLMHCYSGSYEMAKEYIKLGYYLAFGGAVTFKNSLTSKEVATNIPLDRLLIETDCPYMTPVPFRGQRNEPMYVKYTGEEISRLRNIPIDVLQKAICENYKRLLVKE